MSKPRNKAGSHFALRQESRRGSWGGGGPVQAAQDFICLSSAPDKVSEAGLMNIDGDFAVFAKISSLPPFPRSFFSHLYYITIEHTGKVWYNANLVLL